VIVVDPFLLLGVQPTTLGKQFLHLGGPIAQGCPDYGTSEADAVVVGELADDGDGSAVTEEQPLGVLGYFIHGTSWKYENPEQRSNIKPTGSGINPVEEGFLAPG
jgi:hypothetical protein